MHTCLQHVGYVIMEEVLLLLPLIAVLVKTPRHSSPCTVLLTVCFHFKKRKFFKHKIVDEFPCSV